MSAVSAVTGPLPKSTGHGLSGDEVSSPQCDKGKGTMEMDNEEDLLDTFVTENLVSRSFMDLDCDLAEDTVLHDDTASKTLGGRVTATGTSTTVNSATDRPVPKPRKKHLNKRKRAGTNTSVRKEASALKFDYSLPRPP